MWTRFLRCRKGSPAVEFALLLPLLLTVVVGIIEVSSILNQKTAVEKGLRAAGMVAARSPDATLSAATITSVQQAASRGVVSATAPFLIAGWGSSTCTADFTACLTITQRTAMPVGTGAGFVEVDVFVLEATVPYTPIVPGFFAFVGGVTLDARHEQARIGY